MSFLVNLRHLEAHNVRLEGELPVEKLDIDTRDEMIRLVEPLRYELEAQKLEGALLVQGELHLVLECQCVRCLKPFRYRLDLENWTAHLPLQGEDAVTVNNDRVDLTPYLREDILLEFPQHPLCNPECGGLPKATAGKTRRASSAGQSAQGSPAWDQLNRLKF
jgi:uncharacterized protein